MIYSRRRSGESGRAPGSARSPPPRDTLSSESSWPFSPPLKPSPPLAARRPLTRIFPFDTAERLGRLGLGWAERPGFPVFSRACLITEWFHCCVDTGQTDSMAIYHRSVEPQAAVCFSCLLLYCVSRRAGGVSDRSWKKHSLQRVERVEG